MAKRPVEGIERVVRVAFDIALPVSDGLHVRLVWVNARSGLLVLNEDRGRSVRCSRVVDEQILDLYCARNSETPWVLPVHPPND